MTFPALIPPSSQVLFKSDVYNIDALLMASSVVICDPKWAPVALVAICDP